MEIKIRSRSLSEKVVLLSMADLELSGTTPTHTGEVIRATKDHVDAVEADTMGKLSESEVNRALNRLEAEGYVEIAETGDTSPVGKGRPAYTLGVDVEAIIDALADDDAVGHLADRVASETA
ncbi:MAG: Cdc6-like AAA superfamily ATPase [Haloarculaceae archaeon]|jgi:Cdc6-like AAA superfamily ATPase